MVPGSFAETLGQITRDLDLRELMDMSVQEITAKDYHAMNVVTAYVLSRLAASQSMGLIGAGFKNPKAAVTMMTKRFPALPRGLDDIGSPLPSLPYITPQTLAYALSLVLLAVCYSSTDIMTKGKAALQYEKLVDDFTKDGSTLDEWSDALGITIRSYLFNVTSAEVEPARRPSESAAQDAASAADAVAAGSGDDDNDAKAGDEGDDVGGDGIEEDSAKNGDDTGDGAAAAGSQIPTPQASPGTKKGKTKASGGKKKK